MTRQRHERGSSTIELAVLTPAVILMLGLVIMAGRVALAKQAVDTVAYDAARAASIARDAADARSSARTAAQYSLTNNHLSCAPNTVIDTSGFNRPPGQPATVTVAISCTVKLSDLALPGVPGTLTITRTATSPLDTFRERAK